MSRSAGPSGATEPVPPVTITGPPAEDLVPLSSGVPYLSPRSVSPPGAMELVPPVNIAGPLAEDHVPLSSGVPYLSPACDSDAREDSLLGACFNETVNESMKLPVGYEHAAILLMSWAREHDALGVGKEVDQVEALFKKEFNFKTERLSLNTKKLPQHQLHAGLSKFVWDNDGPHNLMIIYYGGHGYIEETGKPGTGSKILKLAERDILHKDTDLRAYKHDPCVSWNKAEERNLLEVSADVVVIFDCCYASDIQVRAISPPQVDRSYEILSAAMPGRTAPGPGPNSFTPVFVKTARDLLEECKDQHPRSFTVQDLCERIAMDRDRDLHPYHGNRMGFLYGKLNGRAIRLAPLNREDVEREDDTSDLLGTHTVTVSFTTNSKPTVDEVRRLGKHLPQAFKDSHIGLRRCQWVGLRKPNHIIFATQQFKKILERKRKLSETRLEPSGGVSKVHSLSAS